MKNSSFLIILPAFIFLSCRSTIKDSSSVENDIVPDNWNADLSGFIQKDIKNYWANEFNATDLTDLIKLCNKNNPELNSMYQRVVARGEDATMAGAMLLPNANANVSGSKTKRNLIGFNSQGKFPPMINLAKEIKIISFREIILTFDYLAPQFSWLLN